MLILRSRAVIAPPATAAWDINRAGPGWAVSSDGLTATCSSKSFTTILAGPKSYTLGAPAKVYFELAVFDYQAGISIGGYPGGVLHGLANASAPLATYLGSNANSTSFQPTDSWPGQLAWWWRNNVNTSSPNVRIFQNTNYNIGIAVDFGARRLWGTVNGTTWNATGTDNPNTGAGGFDLSLINGGDYYIATTGNLQIGSAPSTATLVTKAPFGFPQPAGFDLWGS